MTYSRFKRMNRSARLDSARSWLPTYTGKRIAHAYRRRYGVDWETAFLELSLLGVEIDPDYIAAVRSSVAAQREQGRGARTEDQSSPDDALIDSDEFHAYIAGYTSGGFSYGIPWDEDSTTRDDDDHNESN